MNVSDAAAGSDLPLDAIEPRELLGFCGTMLFMTAQVTFVSYAGSVLMEFPIVVILLTYLFVAITLSVLVGITQRNEGRSAGGNRCCSTGVSNLAYACLCCPCALSWLIRVEKQVSTGRTRSPCGHGVCRRTDRHEGRRCAVDGGLKCMSRPQRFVRGAKRGGAGGEKASCPVGFKLLKRRYARRAKAHRHPKDTRRSLCSRRRRQCLAGST